MVELELPKLAVRVRFPSPAPPQAQVNGLPTSCSFPRRGPTCPLRALGHLPVVLPVMPTIRDLKAAEARNPGASETTDCVAAAVKGSRQRFASLAFTGIDTKRIADLLAAVQPTDGVLHQEASLQNRVSIGCFLRKLRCVPSLRPSCCRGSGSRWPRPGG